MAAVTSLALAGLILGMVAFYTVALLYFPSLFGDPDAAAPSLGTALPTWYEWEAYLLLWLAGTTGTLFVAVRLTRRLSRPLDAVGLAARRLAAGDLAARAQVDGPAFEETKQLVSDFNTMASQLAAADAELRTRNAAVSHELRTPLTILRGRLQGLADGVFAPDHTLFARLVDEVDTLVCIVDDLHLLSLANSGRMVLRLEQIDLAREAATVIALANADLKASDVDIRANLESAKVRADGARVRQALLALLENVRKHAAPGIVYVETKVLGVWAILRVRDSGPGFPPGNEELAFSPFWRADVSRSRKSGGSGLGLTVVRAIAEAQGGTASARSDAEGGAIVEVRLPCLLFASDEKPSTTACPGA
ncbi:ATP-binding protein [Enhydrobacter aerosaccus]|nr:ATP-binding protein [Enhydrobacter aerosaccus]